MPENPRGIDPRGPRFAAAITSVLLLVDVFLALIGASVAAFILLAVITLLFVWGVVSPRTAPWGALYRAAVQPRLAPPAELEDPRPPRFAQGVGLLVTAVGIVLFLAGVSWGVLAAAAAAFVAAFLNAAFGLCLGCELYLVLQRAGVLGRRPAGAA
ncbi:DUF4395 domain-containing protein [Microbacterium sp. bgisy207]|jgi:hypothetical protein|uniref:DUF4395 domain-containing protein n=1 Tax=Microbacterium sp. bgisy207 TaxID=3413800 RepID=UPI003EBEC3A4